MGRLEFAWVLGIIASLTCGACKKSENVSGSQPGVGGSAGAGGTAATVPSGGGGSGGASSTGGVAGGGGEGGGATPDPVKKPTVDGFAQKGPLLNGANLVLSELDEFLSPTGRTLLTTIVDDSGAFRFRNVELVGPVAGVRVDGFFFNEVRGERSASQISLSAITDLTDRAAVNINLASHIEACRSRRRSIRP